MSTIEILSKQEKALVALAASITSGCLPCTEHYLKSLREVGATEAEVGGAIDIALAVRNNATNNMARAAQRIPTDEYLIDEFMVFFNKPINELVLIGAALASNTVNSPEFYLTRARAAGATTRQIQLAAGIARAIRNEAHEKADAIVWSFIGQPEVEKDDHLGGSGEQADKHNLKHPTKYGTTNEMKEESHPPSCGCNYFLA